MNTTERQAEQLSCLTCGYLIDSLGHEIQCGSLAVTAGRPQPMTKHEIAVHLLTAMFKTRERIPIAEVVAEGKKHDVSRQTLWRYSRELGITTLQMGGKAGGIWLSAKGLERMRSRLHDAA